MCQLSAKAAFVEVLLLTAGPSPAPKSCNRHRLFMTVKEPTSTEPVVPRYDPIADWIPPPRDAIRHAQEERVAPLRFLTSPVFFSTDARTGRRHRGLSRIPAYDRGGEGRGVRCCSFRTISSVSKRGGCREECEQIYPRTKMHHAHVVSHAFMTTIIRGAQTVGIDSWMVVSELLEQRDIFVRSLVHPIVYDSDSGIRPSTLPTGATTDDASGPGGPPDGADQFIQTFGAVKVSPKNLYRLMETGQPALLFPGGARESFHGRGGEYTLSAWPDGRRTDFVRIAAKFNATIVPFSSVGAAESAIFLADPPDRKKVPFGVSNAISNLLGENAPYDARYDNGEALTFPLVLPKPIPARHSFLFHKPIFMTHIDHRDREGCRKVYDEVKMEIKRGINDLLVASKKDPFNDPARRIIFERLWRRQAPTFPVDELNSLPSRRD